MTGKPAAILADYVDYRRIKGRKVLQIVCEVPLEQAPMVHTYLGEPDVQGRQIPVAIALIDPEKVKTEIPQSGADARWNKPKEREKFDTLLLCKQAGILCETPDFQRFCIERFGRHQIEFAGSVAGLVRQLCNVQSRRELDDPSKISERNIWLDIRRSYEGWTQANRHAESLGRPGP